MIENENENENNLETEFKVGRLSSMSIDQSQTQSSTRKMATSTDLWLEAWQNLHTYFNM